MITNIGSIIFYFLGVLILFVYTIKALIAFVKTVKEKKRLVFKVFAFLEFLALACMTLGVLFCLAYTIILFSPFSLPAILILSLIFFAISNIVMVFVNVVNIIYIIRLNVKEELEKIENSSLSSDAKERYKNFIKVDARIKYVESIFMMIFQTLMFFGIIFAFNPILIAGGLGTVLVLIEKYGIIDIIKKIRGIDIKQKEINIIPNEEMQTIDNYENDDIQTLVNRFVMKEYLKIKFYKNPKKLDKEYLVNHFKNQMKKKGFFLYYYRMFYSDQHLIGLDNYIQAAIDKIIDNYNFKEINNISASRWKIGLFICLGFVTIVVCLLLSVFCSYFYLFLIILAIIFFYFAKNISNISRKSNIKKL
jgi:hypothetical protein